MPEDVHVETRPAVYRPTQVAARLEISRAKAYRLIRSGAIPSVRVGARGLRVRVADFDAYLEALTAPPSGGSS